MFERNLFYPVTKEDITANEELVNMKAFKMFAIAFRNEDKLIVKCKNGWGKSVFEIQTKRMHSKMENTIVLDVDAELLSMELVLKALNDDLLESDIEEYANRTDLHTCKVPEFKEIMFEASLDYADKVSFLGDYNPPKSTITYLGYASILAKGNISFYIEPKLKFEDLLDDNRLGILI